MTVGRRHAQAVRAFHGSQHVVYVIAVFHQRRGDGDARPEAAERADDALPGVVLVHDGLKLRVVLNEGFLSDQALLKEVMDPAQTLAVFIGDGGHGDVSISVG